MSTSLLSPSVLALVSAVLLIACCGQPAIRPSDAAGTAEIIRQCRNPFPGEAFRFIHSIETGISGQSGTLLGITLVDPKARKLRSAILTLEGMVLFEAVLAEKTDVIRALPPFDSTQFAENMMKDVRLVFLAPEGLLLKTGKLGDGSAVCRYGASGSGTVDVIVASGISWSIRAYGEDGRTRRIIRAFSIVDGIPRELNLTGFSERDYSLKMKLISAERIAGNAF